jgi:diphthine-ammonia ligase
MEERHCASLFKYFPKIYFTMALSGIFYGKPLVSQHEWFSQVNSWKESVDNLGFFKSKEEAKKSIRDAFFAAVKENAEYGNSKFGVLLSGGVDSSFIALALKQQGFNFKCFSVGILGSKDLVAAKHAADLLGLKLYCKEYSILTAEKVVKETVKLLKTDDPVTIGIAATEFAAVKLASSYNVKVLFTGLGSEEIFAGYQRHALSSDVHEECWSGLKQMWSRDFLRDSAVLKHFRATALTPFLDKNLVQLAMRARPEWKISVSEKKLILREIAFSSGLPIDIAFRPKLAAQYGSGFDKALEKLSKRAGFTTKREYLRHVVI